MLGLENLSVEWVMDFSSGRDDNPALVVNLFVVWLQALALTPIWNSASTVGFNAIWPSDIPPSSIEP